MIFLTASLELLHQCMCCNLGSASRDFNPSRVCHSHHHRPCYSKLTNYINQLPYIDHSWYKFTTINLLITVAKASSFEWLAYCADCLCACHLPEEMELVTRSTRLLKIPDWTRSGLIGPNTLYIYIYIYIYILLCVCVCVCYIIY